jgi:F-type H+-transporting ATPase subunit delta
MQVASRASFAQAREALDATANRVDSATLTTIAGELLSAGRLFDREPVLRRSLSDPSAATGVRQRLLDAVVQGQLSEPTMDLLHTVVTARWSTPADLSDALELLAVQALLAAAQEDGTLADVEDQLFRFLRVFVGNPALQAALGDSTADVERRDRLVSDLLGGGKAQPVTEALVKVAVAGLGGRGFEPSLERLVELAAQRRDREVAYVTVAAPLTEAQEQRLEAALARIYGRQMSLLIVVDPTLLGGMTVRVGQELYDGSVSRRLEQVRSALAG